MGGNGRETPCHPSPSFRGKSRAAPPSNGTLMGCQYDVVGYQDPAAEVDTGAGCALGPRRYFAGASMQQFPARAVPVPRAPGVRPSDRCGSISLHPRRGNPGDDSGEGAGEAWGVEGALVGGSPPDDRRKRFTSPKTGGSTARRSRAQIA